MSNEEKYLITLCMAYLNSDTVSLDSSIDYNALYELSCQHNLTAIVYCVIKNSDNIQTIPQEILNKYENSFFEAIFRYNYQSSVIELINTLLTDNHINHIFFKGSEIKEYFPVPQARVMGDIDVLIPAAERDNVKKLLCDNGFTCKNSNGPVYDYEKDGVLIEVHTKIISGKVGNSNCEEYFLNAIDHASFDHYSGKLNPEYNFLYLITHIAHHFWFYGAGIKLIIDLAVMLTHFDIDIEKVLSMADKINLKEFTQVILTVCKKWFGCGQAFSCDTAKTEEFLLHFGAFGNVNRNNSAVIQRKELEEGKKNSFILTRLRLLFPAYSKIKEIPYIRFIEGRPYLLPFAWIYRIIYNFKNRKEFVRNATTGLGSDETNKTAVSELAYFEEIGLL